MEEIEDTKDTQENENKGDCKGCDCDGSCKKGKKSGKKQRVFSEIRR